MAQDSLPIRGQVAHVTHVDRQLHELARRAADGRESDTDIAEGLIRVRLEIVLAHESAVPIQRDLSSDVHERRKSQLASMVAPRSATPLST